MAVREGRSYLVRVGATCLAVALATLLAGEADAQSRIAPVLIPVSGQLTAPGGQPRTGTVVLAISLYERQDDAAPLWVEHQRVVLSAEGAFDVVMGATFPEGLPTELFGDGVARFVGVAAEGESEQPRRALMAVPYASRSQTADTLGGQPPTAFLLTENFKTSLRSALQAPDLRASLQAPAAPSIAGTTNCLAKFDGSGSPTATSALCEANNRVGLGVVSPSRLLDVNGDARLGSSTMGSVIVRSGGANVGVLRPGTQNGALLLSDDSEQASRGLMILNGGLVGVGTASPTHRLHVFDERPNGIAAFFQQRSSLASNGLFVQTNTLSAGDTAFSASSNGGANQLLIVRNNGFVGIGTQTPAMRLDVNGSARIGSSASGAVLIKSTGASSAVIRPAVSNGSITISDDSELPTRGLIITSGGRVGIGTATPTAKLHVAGAAYVSGDMTVDGNIGAKYQDVAEYVDSLKAIEAGMVVSIDPDAPNRVVVASRAYDSRVAGAVSAQPGIVLGVPGPGRVLVAQSGRVRIKADARYGAIRIGDLLVSSPSAGRAMRASGRKVRPGTVLGKALEALPNGDGDILALITLQ